MMSWGLGLVGLDDDGVTDGEVVGEVVGEIVEHPDKRATTPRTTNNFLFIILFSSRGQLSIRVFRTDLFTLGSCVDCLV
jgi:hypothetical protein